MSRRLLWALALAIMLTAPLAVLRVAPVFAAPSAAETAADRARVDAAIAKLDAIQRRASDLEARARRVGATLDQVLADEQAAYDRLEVRAVAIYRSGDDSVLEILLTSETIEDFVARWEALSRMSEQDIEDIRTLETKRVEATRSAQSLMRLQADQAKAADLAAAELAAARRSLADSTAALAAYEARVAKAAAARRAAAAAAAKKNRPSQTLTGTGTWLSGRASMYGLNFSGRGASGYRITPYSMMVAHKTLPFHTLVEIEYGGRRCVASVEDRGPYTPGRVLDLGPGVARVLGFAGVHEVRFRVIGR